MIPIMLNTGRRHSRAIGDSNRPFIYLAVAVTNVILELMTIGVFRLGVIRQLSLVLSNLVTTSLIERLLRANGAIS